MLASTPNTISNTIDTKKYKLELRVSSPLLLRELATAVAIIRDKKITKVFNTPCNKAIVTISPFAI